jgi:glycosyltransferase involved in cell wall biosynthesis
VNPHTFVVPNACHYEHFAGCAGRDALRSTAMREMAGRYRRIAGYYGWMMPHRLDVALLVAVIAAQPDWGFVFLGPADRAVSAELRRLPNVRLWDTVPHAALPSYVAGFDVCVLPHLVNDHTAGNDPLKLYEYLASGKPVVATPAAGVLRFREHLAVAQTADEFAAALPAALAADSPERRRARQEVARANSWAVRADQVEGILGAIGAWSRLRAS